MLRRTSMHRLMMTGSRHRGGIFGVRGMMRGIVGDFMVDPLVPLKRDIWDSVEVVGVGDRRLRGVDVSSSTGLLLPRRMFSMAAGGGGGGGDSGAEEMAARRVEAANKALEDAKEWHKRRKEWLEEIQGRVSEAEEALRDCSPEKKESAKDMLARFKEHEYDDKRELREAKKKVDQAEYEVWKEEKKIESIEHSPKWAKVWLESAKPLAEGEERLFSPIRDPLPCFLNPEFLGARNVHTVDLNRTIEYRSKIEGSSWMDRVNSALEFLSTLSVEETDALLPDLQPFIMPVKQKEVTTRAKVLYALLHRTKPDAKQDMRSQYITGSIGSAKSQLCRNLAAAIAIAQPQLDDDGKGITNFPIYVENAGEASLLPSAAVAVGLAHRGLLFRKGEDGSLRMPSWVDSDLFVDWNWLEKMNLRVVLFMDEAQEMYTSKFGAYRAGIASHQLEEAASCGTAAITTTLTGSSSVLRPLLLAARNTNLAEAYPGLRHAKNVNGSKFVWCEIGPITDTLEAARFLESSGRKEWSGIVERVEEEEEDALDEVCGAMMRSAGNARVLSLAADARDEDVGLIPFSKAMGSGLAPIAAALWELTKSAASRKIADRDVYSDVEAFRAGKFKMIEKMWYRDTVVQWLKEHGTLSEKATQDAIEKVKGLDVQEWADRGFLQANIRGQVLALPTTAHFAVTSTWTTEGISDADVRAIFGCSPEAEQFGEKLVAEALFTEDGKLGLVPAEVGSKLPTLKWKDWRGECESLVDRVWKVSPDHTGEDLIVFKQDEGGSVKVFRVQVATGPGSAVFDGVGELRAQKKGETVWRMTKHVEQWQNWVVEKFGIDKDSVNFVHIIAATTKVKDKEWWAEALRRGVKSECWDKKDSAYDVLEDGKKQTVKPTTTKPSSFLLLCNDTAKFEGHVLDYNALAPMWPRRIRDYAKREGIVHIMGSRPSTSSSSS